METHGHEASEQTVAGAAAICAADRQILREMAQRKAEIASLDIQQERISRWCDIANRLAKEAAS